LLRACIVDRPADFLEQQRSLPYAEASFVTVAIDGLAVHVFHDQERQAVIRLSTVEQLGDIWMIEIWMHLTFSAEALYESTVCPIRSQNLDCDFVFKLLVDSPAEVDIARSARAEQFDELIIADTLFEQGGSWRFVNLGSDAANNLIQIDAAVVIRCEQGM
jgi:hypothetical protein